MLVLVIIGGIAVISPAILTSWLLYLFLGKVGIILGCVNIIATYILAKGDDCSWDCPPILVPSFISLGILSITMAIKEFL